MCSTAFFNLFKTGPYSEIHVKYMLQLKNTRWIPSSGHRAINGLAPIYDPVESFHFTHTEIQHASCRFEAYKKDPCFCSFTSFIESPEFKCQTCKKVLFDTKTFLTFGTLYKIGGIEPVHEYLLILGFKDNYYVP